MEWYALDAADSDQEDGISRAQVLRGFVWKPKMQSGANDSQTLSLSIVPKTILEYPYHLGFRVWELGLSYVAGKRGVWELLGQLFGGGS